MSPPWGGPQYTYADTFQPGWLLPGFNASTLRLIEVALGVVHKTVRRGGDGKSGEWGAGREQ